jgi:hypothetical protein
VLLLIFLGFRIDYQLAAGRTSLVSRLKYALEGGLAVLI